MPDPIAARFVDGFSLLGKKHRIRKFIAELPAHECFVHHPHADGTYDLNPLWDKKHLSQLMPGDMLVQVHTRAFETELIFPELTSKNGHIFDLSLSLVWRIAHPRNFLHTYALPLLHNQDIINPVALESLLMNRCTAPITDEMHSVSYEDLKNCAAFPNVWWTLKLPAWLSLDWLQLDAVSSITYASATADRQMELKSRAQLDAIEHEERAQQQAREIEVKQREAARDNDVRNIKLRQDLSAIERQNQVEMSRMQHDKERLNMQEQAALQKLAAEQERARLEADIASIRNGASAAQERLQQAKAAENENRKMLNAIRKAQDEITQVAAIMQAAAAQGIAHSQRLSNHAVNVCPETLVMLRHNEPMPYLSAMARAKANATPGAVSLKKRDMQSRDIGPRQVKSLAIGTVLDFELASQKSGYVSVLNIGTSGAAYLLAPNGIVQPEQAQIDPSKALYFPGAPLLPHTPLYENGPPGWEEIIVFISRKPLFSNADLAATTTTQPEVRLSGKRINHLLEQLSELPEDDWQAGLLGFLVAA